MPKAQAFERDRLGSDQILGAAVGLGRAVAQRPDAVRVAEREDAVAGDLGHAGVGARAPCRCRQPTARKIASGSRCTPCAAACNSCASTFSSASESDSVLMWRRSRRNISSLIWSRIHQVAVVRQHDAEGRVHVERLRFLGIRRRSGRRVAHVGDAARARQRAHVARAEDVAHQAVALVHAELLAHAQWRCRPRPGRDAAAAAVRRTAAG